MNLDKKQLLMITAIGGLTAALGALLPWVTSSVSGSAPLAGAISRGGSVSGTETGDGVISLICGLIAAACAGALYLGKEKSLPLAPKQLLLTALITVGIAALLYAIQFLFGDYPSQELMGVKVSVSRGIGLWIGFLGTLAGTAAAFFAFTKGGVTVPVPSGDDSGGGESGGGDEGGES